MIHFVVYYAALRKQMVCRFVIGVHHIDGFGVRSGHFINFVSNAGLKAFFCSVETGSPHTPVEKRGADTFRRYIACLDQDIHILGVLRKDLLNVQN